MRRRQVILGAALGVASLGLSSRGLSPWGMTPWGLARAARPGTGASLNAAAARHQRRWGVALSQAQLHNPAF